jgi:ferredoxin-like protein FixX
MEINNKNKKSEALIKAQKKYYEKIKNIRYKKYCQKKVHCDVCDMDITSNVIQRHNKCKAHLKKLHPEEHIEVNKNICAECGNKEYKNIILHRKTKKHIDNIENIKNNIE